MTDTTYEPLKPVSFKVNKIEKANKPGCIVAYVQFNGNDKEYTYVRKYRTDSWNNPKHSITIDGCEIVFKNAADGSYEVVDIYRLYNTKGVKKLSTANQGAKDEKKEEEPAAKAEEPKTVEAAEVPAAKEEQKEEKPGYDPEIK